MFFFQEIHFVNSDTHTKVYVPCL
jgi:hypothetical protein